MSLRKPLVDSLRTKCGTDTNMPTYANGSRLRKCERTHWVRVLIGPGSAPSRTDSSPLINPQYAVAICAARKVTGTPAGW